MDSQKNIHQQKKELRQFMMVQRNVAHAALSGAGNELLAQFQMHVLLSSPQIVAGYMPIGAEMDVRPLMAYARQQGCQLSLPVMVGADKPLEFRLFETETKLVAGVKGIAEPAVGSPVVEPDIVLVPLLAFDRVGNRLGYGGGYYDRTLKCLSARKNIRSIGIGFECQKVKSVPVDDGDVKLDLTVTEGAIYSFRKP